MIEWQARKVLIETARTSIEKGLTHDVPWVVPHEGVDASLLEFCGVFVTLFDREGRLRGCIGSLAPVRPLIDDVAYNAHMAAFGDRRFSPLLSHEAASLQIEISVLSPLRQVFPRSEGELFEMLKPRETGLYIKKGDFSGATFLPSVWEQLPDPVDFFAALKEKGGLVGRQWDDEIEFFIYTVEKIKADEE